MSSTPLRSETDRSDPGFKRRLSSDRAHIEDHAGAGVVHRMSGLNGLIVRADHRPFEGAVENGPYLRLALRLSGSAPLMQRLGDSRLEGVWRAGSVVVGPSDRSGLARSGAVSMIGLAISPQAVPHCPLDAERIERLACGFHDDPLLAAVLTALFYEADAHGASTAFFEHGLSLVFRRLSELNGPVAHPRAARALSQVRLNRVYALVTDRLEADVSVAEMAAAAGMDASGFTRALRARTGLAPYAWLTRLRMERAAGLLAGGLSVTETSSRVGYANASKFARAFRRVTGRSPSEWRREF